MTQDNQRIDRNWTESSSAGRSQVTATESSFAGRSQRRRALLRNGARRGVTLVEVLIVVAIMALIAGGVSFMILPKYRETQVKTATTTARTIRQVATQYIALKSAGDCPTVQLLIAAKELDYSGDTEDPWGQPFKIVCLDDDVTVTSPGPDKKEGTEDDIFAGPSGGSD